jgi:hypothetical protein
MHWHKDNILLFLLAIIWKPCIGQQPADTAANAKTKQVLKFISDLPKQGI